MEHHLISAQHLSIDRIREILFRRLPLALSDDARARIVRCREYLDRKMENPERPVYGITTGFGSLCDISVGYDELAQLQKNLVMSHACGTGERVPSEIVKLILLLKIQSLSYGHSGVQLATVERLIDFFNNDVLPVVYQQGSLGASGDLAPLAHMSLPLLGLGEVECEGRVRPAAEVLAAQGTAPADSAAVAQAKVLVQGIADIVLIYPDHLELLDYKTDRRKTPADFVRAYRAQLELYAKAIDKRFAPRRVTYKGIYSLELGELIEV